MKRSHTSLIAAFWAFMALCFFYDPSWALMRPLGTAEMTQNSDGVLAGTVTGVSSAWDVTGQRIVTRAKVKVTEVVRGVVTTQEVDVETLGGKVGDIVFKLSDMATFEKGQDVLVFLKRTKSMLGAGEAYNVVGSAQGKYDVGADGIARKGGFSIATPALSQGQANMSAPGGAETVPEALIDNDIPVRDLIDKIKAVK